MPGNRTPLSQLEKELQEAKQEIERLQNIGISLANNIEAQRLKLSDKDEQINILKQQNTNMLETIEVLNDIIQERK